MCSVLLFLAMANVTGVLGIGYHGVVGCTENFFTGAVGRSC
jgi:hypothetical protein